MGGKRLEGAVQVLSAIDRKPSQHVASKRELKFVQPGAAAYLLLLLLSFFRVRFLVRFKECGYVAAFPLKYSCFFVTWTLEILYACFDIRFLEIEFFNRGTSEIASEILEGIIDNIWGRQGIHILVEGNGLDLPGCLSSFLRWCPVGKICIFRIVFRCRSELLGKFGAALFKRTYICST